MTDTSDPEIHAILLDIEGTTTPIDFVTKILFPYASRELALFLGQHFEEPETQALLRDLRAQHQLDEQRKLQPPRWLEQSAESRLRSAVTYGQWLMARDSKCASLKALQGKIWQQGYASGELRGEVYPDVPPAFTRWRAQQKKICIYSSGSELAQRLLFSTVASGDLTTFIAGFFDTRVGAKADTDSYRRIAASLALRGEEVLFISDAVKEIEAARRSGMKVLLCIRDADAVPATSQHHVIHNFDGLF